MSEAAVAEQTWSLPQQLFASLPWYDLDEMRDANDAFWIAFSGALRERGIDSVPAVLDRSLPYGFDWNGKCLFTQTCGYPIFTTSRGHFRVVAIPAYAAPGCDGPLHRSFIVVRASSTFASLEDLRGCTFAVNELDSNSGMNLPRHLFAPLSRDGRFLGERVVSGSHATSAELVREGAADAAAVDCVTFALLERYRPQTVSELRVIAQTATTPAPPFATSSRTGDELFGALRQALLSVAREGRHAELRDALLLSDVVLANADAYALVLDYEREARRRGYPVLS